MVAGHADAVKRAIALAEARGAKRAIMLPVSAPFHSPLMAPAAERLAADLEKIELGDPGVPLVSNVGAQLVRDDPEFNPVARPAAPATRTDTDEDAPVPGTDTEES